MQAAELIDVTVRCTSPPPPPPVSASPPPPPAAARREVVRLRTTFANLDAAILNDQARKSLFEANYLAAIFREARNAFVDTVSTIEPEDQGDCA